MIALSYRPQYRNLSSISINILLENTLPLHLYSVTSPLGLSSLRTMSTIEPEEGTPAEKNASNDDKSPLFNSTIAMSNALKSLDDGTLINYIKASIPQKVVQYHASNCTFRRVLLPLILKLRDLDQLAGIAPINNGNNMIKWLGTIYLLLIAQLYRSPHTRSFALAIISPKTTPSTSARSTI